MMIAMNCCNSHHSFFSALIHRSLTMATAFGSLPVLAENISDPSYQLSRLAIIDKDNFLISDSDELKLVNVHSASPLILDEYLDSGNVSRCHSYTLNNLSSLKASPTLSSSASRTMFQSVRIIDNSHSHTTSHQDKTAAAVTSQGDLVLCSLYQNDNQSSYTNTNSNSYSFGTPSYGTAAPSGGQGYGYVSLCCTPDRLVTGHYLSKTLVWNDLSTLVKTRQSDLFCHPSCVVSSFLPMENNNNNNNNNNNSASSVIIVAEGANIAVFDERQYSKGGCLFRENENNNNGGNLWDILPLADTNRVAAAGSDKNIRIYDKRMWKPITKWRAPHKFDVVKLLPSSNNPLQLYVAGRDNEVLLCDLEPHLLSSQVQKVKSRKHAPSSTPSSSTSPVSSSSEVDNHPLKKQKQNQIDNATTTATGNNKDTNAHPLHTTDTGSTASVPISTTQCVELLPMQLPTSSKLRISHHRGVRAESNWAGLDVLQMDMRHSNSDNNSDSDNENGRSTVKDNNNTVQDRLVGLCGHGKVYIADSANLMKLAI